MAAIDPRRRGDSLEAFTGFHCVSLPGHDGPYSARPLSTARDDRTESSLRDVATWLAQIEAKHIEALTEVV